MRIYRWMVGGLLVAVFAGFATVIYLALEQRTVATAGEVELVLAEGQPYKRSPDERGGITVLNEDSSLVRALDQGADEQVVERILPPPETAPRSAAEVLQSADPDQGVIELAALQPPTTLPAEIEVLESDEGDTAVAQVILAVATAEDGSVPASGADLQSVAPAVVTAPVIPRAAPNRPATVETVAAVEQLAMDEPTPHVQVVTEPPPVVDPASISDAYRVQLGAVREEARAEVAWSQFQDLYPTVLSGGEPHIVRADTANGVFYRVQAGRYGSRDSAQSACDQIKQLGGDCFVVQSAN